MSQNQVCLFFFVNGEFLIHGCSLQDAEKYGDFLIYPDSHFEVWETHYEKRHGVDYDYFPRGRVAYRKEDQTFLIFYDKCIEPEIHRFLEGYADAKVFVGYDEHYQCHACNRYYVI